MTGETKSQGFESLSTALAGFEVSQPCFWANFGD